MAKRRGRSGMHNRQRGKNLTMLFALLAFVVVVYLVSIVRMGGN